MKKILLFLAALLPQSLGFCGDFNRVEHTYATLLTSNDGELIELGAKSMYNVGNKNPDLLDIVAEVLWISVEQGVKPDKRVIKYNSRSEEDTVSWLAKTLGESGLGGYRSVLKESFALTKSKKLKRYIKQAYDSLGDYDGESYQVGSVSIDSVRDSLNDYRKNESVKSTDFSKIKNGQVIEEVYDEHGLPDDISLGFRRIYRPGVFIYHPLLRVHYVGKGMVEFDHADNEDKKWMVYNLYKPLDVDMKISRDDNLGIIKHSLLMQAGFVVKQTAQKIYKEKLFSTDILDVAAERVYHSMDSVDDETADGIAWIFNSIGASKNGRYRYVTEYAIEHSANDKVIRYAQKVLGQLSTADSVGQYKKGDIAVSSGADGKTE